MASVTRAFHKPLGSIALVKPITDRLGLRELVDKYVPMERNRGGGLSHGQVIEALVANRLSSPRPLYRVEDWAAEYAVEEVYGIPAGKLNDDRVGRALDAIFPYLEELKAELAMRVLTEFDLRKDQVIYDLTSLCFEGEYEDSMLITYGYSSTGDGDKKQVNLGLNVNPEGVPLYHRVMEGNRVDKLTVAENMRSLRRVLRTSSFLMIGDRGVMTKRNLARMQEKGVGYLGSYQLDKEAKEMIKAIPEEEFRLLDYVSRKGGRYYGAERMISFRHKGREYTTRAIVVKSEEKAEKDRERREKALERLKEGLERIREKLNTGKYKRREYVRARLEKLFAGRMRRYRKLLEVRLEGEDGRLSLDYSLRGEAVEEEARLDGKYVLLTDQRMEAEEALRTYKSRNLVEVRIRDFKQALRVRPLFLQSDQRIASLVFVNVLALMVYSVLEFLARRMGMEVTARRLLEGFRGISVIFLSMEDGTKEALAEELTPWQAEVVERLGFPSPGRIIRARQGS